MEIDKHHNKDKVLKESMEVFKGGTLDFLGVEANGTIEDVLSGEITETTTKKAYADTVFRVSGNKGLHLEWEVDISEDDMKRFASYHFDLHRKHYLNFETVIITSKPSTAQPIKTFSGSFSPKIISLKERDAEATIADIEGKLSRGEKINLLELLYLPLYGNTHKTERELLDYAVKMTPKAAYNKHTQEKLTSLMFLLMSTFISRAEIKKVWRDNIMSLENNVFVDVIEEWSKEKMALKMLSRNMSMTEIAEILEMPLEWVEEIKNSQNSQEAMAI